ncbi:RidA family protein [Alicyclobacillaceae bacterium I2511]|nr:RidA family protein [Alicyclobacillaceae bacterium I2511]
MKEKITTNKAPNPSGPYSQGIKINNRIYIAGQGPVDVSTGEMPSGVYAQTRQVLMNIQEILSAAGARIDDVVKVTAHLVNFNDFEEFNRAYAEFFRDPFPVRTTVESGLNNILVEIDVIAEIG